MKKKLISAMIYIYIAVVVGVVASAETITAVGLSFPIGWLQKSDSMKTTEDLFGDKYTKEGPVVFVDCVQTGIQGTAKVRHIFYSRFVLGADFEIGASTMKIKGEKDPDKYLDLNLDLAIGYAIVDTEKFTLIASAIVGLHHQKQTSEITFNDGSTLDEVLRYTAFEYGGELFMNFKIGDCIGLFASCKIVNNIGKIRDEAKGDWFGEKWLDYTEEHSKTTAIGIKPSIGISFAF